MARGGPQTGTLIVIFRKRYHGVCFAIGPSSYTSLTQNPTIDFQLYVLNADSHRGEDHDNTTELDGQKISWPPLNISTYFLPSTFYWNSTANLSEEPEPYGKLKDLKFIVGSDLYNMTQLKEHGVCQPKEKVNPPRTIICTQG